MHVAYKSLMTLLTEQNSRPELFSAYTAHELWTDPHLARQMLAYHLDPDQDIASRNHAFIGRAAGWLAETFGLAGGRRVLDLGCGPGLYANGLAESGADVTGGDFSGNSLAHARAAAASRGLRVEYLQADYLDVEIEGPFDLVLLIYGDLCALGPDQRRSLLHKVRGWLAPEGRFVFDVFSSVLFDGLGELATYETAPDGGFWSPDPYFLFTNRFKYPDDAVFLDRHLIIEKDRHREFFNWIQCYDRNRLKAELREAGWDVEQFVGSVAGDPWDQDSNDFAVIARSVASA